MAEDREYRNRGLLVKSDRPDLLLEVNNAVVSKLELKDLIEATSACVQKVVAHDLAVLYIYEPEIDRLRAHGLKLDTTGNEFADSFVLPVDGSPSGEAFRSGETIVATVDDFGRYHPAITDRIKAEGFQTLCSAPLLAGERALGALTFMSADENAYTTDVSELISKVAGQIAIAVDNALHYGKARRETERFGMLLEVSNALSAVLELKDVLKITSTIVRRHVRCDHAGIGLYDPDHHQFRILALENPSGSFQDEGTIFAADDTPDYLAFTSRKPVLRRQVDLREFKAPYVKFALDAGVRSFCVVPLISRNRPIGVLAVGNNDEDSLTGSDAETLQLIANQIAGAVQNAVHFDEIERLKDRLTSEILYLEEEIQSEYNFAEIVGTSATLRNVLRQIETVAPTDSCVLLYGETGTGKELISRAIHNLSGRRERTLVKLNCAAIPTGLLESELFGHEKGAFTGAVAPRVGRFELAHKGTLLLDEIGDIPLELQPKLLRVLQEQEFERLGSSRTVKTDVRLIAATNCDLRQMVEEKKFRSDLYYRLNVFPITIPPLRERREDIPLLAGYFAQKHARRMSKRIESIPRASLDTLCSYEFPGNVRELENFIERAVILTRGEELQMPLSELQHFKRPMTDDGVPTSASLRDIEKSHIAETLKRTGGKVAGADGAASLLNMPVSTLRHKMKKHGLL